MPEKGPVQPDHDHPANPVQDRQRFVRRLLPDTGEKGPITGLAARNRAQSAFPERKAPDDVDFRAAPVNLWLWTSTKFSILVQEGVLEGNRRIASALLPLLALSLTPADTLAQETSRAASQARWNLTPRDFGALERNELLAKAGLENFREWIAGANAGDSDAMVLLSLARRIGNLPELDDYSAQAAHDLMMRAAASGNARARFELADAGYSAMTILSEEERKLVRDWLKAAADEGHPLAQMRYGIWQIEGRHGVAHSPAEGLERLLLAAEANVVPAMLYLGTLQPSDGPPRDYRMFSGGDVATVHGIDPFIPAPPEFKLPAADIAYWLRRAAEQGSSQARFGMALLHANGWGVPKDQAREVEWHRSAVETVGSTRNFGVYEWALRLINGDGVAVDRATALALTREHHAAWDKQPPWALTGKFNDIEWASWLMHPKAGYFKDEIYYDVASRLTERPDIVIALLSHLANEGKDEAMRMLGFVYSEGSYRGKPLAMAKDFSKALSWFERAAGRGNGTAMILAARLHYDGKGTARNTAAAYAWLERAQKSRSERTRENAALEIARFKERDAIRAENARIAKERAEAEERAWAMQVAREQARIDRQNAAEAAAYRRISEQRSALNREAWRYYRPQFTGFPTLDAIEAQRAWSAAQSSVRFYEYCRTNNCYAQQSRSGPGSTTAGADRRSSGGSGSRSSNIGSAAVSDSVADRVGTERAARSGPTTVGRTASTSAAQRDATANAARTTDRATTAERGRDAGEAQRSELTLTVNTPFVPEPPPRLPEVPRFVPTPRPEMPSFKSPPCPPPGGCVTQEGGATPPEVKAAMDRYQAALKAADAADAAQRQRIEAIRKERERIDSEYAKRQHARQLACDAGDASQCSP